MHYRATQAFRAPFQVQPTSKHANYCNFASNSLCHVQSQNKPQPSILAHHPIQVLVLLGCSLSIHQLVGFLLDDLQSLIVIIKQCLQAVQLFLMGLQNRSEKILLYTTLGSERKRKETRATSCNMLQCCKGVENMNPWLVIMMQVPNASLLDRWDARTEERY